MRTHLTRAFAVAAMLAASGIVALGGAPPAGAVAVSTEAELRAAFADAGETSIELTQDIDLETCAGGDSGDLLRNSATALTIFGNGFTITQTCTGERVMQQTGAGELVLDHVTLTGGNLTGGGSGGGAVSATGGGVVTLQNATTITGNSVSTTLGGGGVNAETVNVVSSTISGNQAGDFGGAINAVTVNVTSSTVSGNTSAGRAGGISAATATVINSTIAGNTAQGATAPANQGGGIYVSTVNLVYATVDGNTAASSANVYAQTAINVFGAAIAHPLGGGSNCGGGGVTSSSGYNFSDDSSCALAGTGDRQSAGSPELGALADNGGPTLTMLPSPTSPLLGVIPADACQTGPAVGITTDQRGVARPQGGTCDIGAVEVEGATLLVIQPRFTG